MAKKIGVVIALDGEKEFSQKMKNAQQNAKSLDSSLKDLTEQYKDNANSADFLSKKQELLEQKQKNYEKALDHAKSAQKKATEAYKEQAKEVAQLQKSYDEAKTSLDKMSKTDPGYAKQAAEVQKWEHQLNQSKITLAQLDGKVSSWDAKVAKAEKDVTSNSKAVDRNAKYLDEAANSADKCATSIDKMGNEASAAADKSKGLGEGLKTALAVAAGNIAAQAVTKLKDAAIDAAKYVVEVGSGFEASMSKVEALSGASTADLEKMTAKAKTLGASTSFSAKEVADGFSYMALAGWDTGAMLSSIDGLVNLAAASEMDLAEASDMVTDYLTAFGLSADYAGKMADELAYAQANSNTTTRLLGDAFGNCAANMNAAGQTMETTTAILEAMANQGTKGAEAGTALSAVMRDIGQKAKNGAIQIGKTSVAVQDSEGNYRDLIDILKDVEKATEGMGTAERDAALRKTFTKNSIKAVNEALTEGVGKIESYRAGLENSTGAAAQMAETMMDNVSGSVTKFNSALEGLGIALFDKISGPLKGLIDLGTSAVSVITDVLTPEIDADPIVQYIGEVKAAREELETAMDAAQTSYNDAAGSVELIGSLGDRLMALNGLEETTLEQKAEMRTLVSELSQYIPELADAYDGETGALNLTNQEIEAYIRNKQLQLTENAKAAAQQEIMNKLLIAESQKLKADENVAAAKAKKESIESEINSVRSLASEYEDLRKKATGIDMGTEAGEREIDRMQEIQKELQGIGINIDTVDDYISILEGDLNTTNNTLNSATEEQKKVNEAIKEGKKELQEIDQAAKTLGAGLTNSEGLTKVKENITNIAKAASDLVKTAVNGIESVDNAGKRMGFFGKVSDQVGKVIDKQKEAISTATGWLTMSKEEMQAMQEAAKAAEDAAAKQAKAVKDAAEKSKNAVTEAWQSMKDQAAQSITFSMFAEFDGGDDLTTEKMNAALDSQLEGYQKYAENLAKMREYVAQGILSPEFFSNLEQQGISAANEINHMVWTVENQGEYGVEQVKSLSDKWTESLNWQDMISSAIAGDQAALEDGLKSLGSSDAEFDALSNAVSNGLDNASQTMKSEIQSLLDTAQTVGATIPDGLTEAINNGEINADDVKEQLQSAIDGAVDGLSDLIEQQGGQVDESLIQGIKEGTADVQDAYDQLISELASGISVPKEMQDAGKEAVTTPLAKSIQEGQQEVVDAIGDVATAASEEAKNKAKEFHSAGQESAKQYTDGILSGKRDTSAAGGETAGAGVEGARNNTGGAYSVGLQISAGVAQGISAGSNSVAHAGRQMIEAALSAMRAQAEIRSPSRRFRDIVGKNIGKGTALGIALSTKDNEKAAQTMIEKTIIAARKVAKKAGTSDDLAYLWQTVTAKAIANNFGITRKVTKSTTTQNGKKVTTKTKESDDSYYGNILSAAQTYFDQLSIYQKQSTKSEVDYWKNVRKRLKTGTTAYQQATQKINDLKAQIGNSDVAQSLLDTYQIYYDMSENQEEQYWNKIRKLYKVGTEDREKADQRYLEAKKKRTEKLKALEEDYLQKVEEVNAKYTDAVSERKDAILSAFDIFDAFESTSASGEELLFNMQSQAEGYEYWRNQLAELEKRGILSGDLMGELKEKGPQDTAAIVALNGLSDGQLTQYQQAYEKKMDQSDKQAKEENKNLKVTVEKELASLKANYSSQVAEVNKGLDTQTNSLITALKKTAADEVTRIIGVMAYGKNGVMGTASANQIVAAPATSATPSTASSSSSSKSASSKKNKLKEIINSAAAHSKTVSAAEKKSHSDLWQYVVKKYGRSIKTATIQKLAKELGVNLKNSSKPTSAEKTKVLNALKKAGLRSGTRSLDDIFAWMDEEGLGSEMVVREDGARLRTGLKKGDAIVPAANTDNLYDWSELKPDAFFAAMERQQKEIQAYVNRMTAMVSMNELNRRMLPGAYAPAVSTREKQVNSDQVLSLMQQMVELLQAGKEIYLDTGEFVGGTAGKMSSEFAARKRRRR